MRTYTYHHLSLLFVLLCSSTLSAATYYWVGGSGDWSDISHWATSSGGGITHAQAPTADDDVIFDFNSFAAPGQTVTFNTDIIFCRSMSWLGVTNTPTLIGAPNVRLNIFGSLELDPNMEFNFSGRTTFTGALTDNVVNYGTHTAGQDVTFDGTGAWTLNNGITVDSAFVLSEGSLTTNNQNIDCKYFHSRTTNTRTLNLGFSVITIRGGTIDPFDGSLPNRIIQPLRLHAANLTFDAGESLFILIDPVVDIWYEGPGTLAFNRVIFASPMGNSRILPWNEFGDSSTFPTVTFNELNLFHRTLLNGSMTVNSLLLQPGQRYTFESGQTFNFDLISAIGDCRTVIALEATDAADPAQFITDDNITVRFVNLRGIAAGGSGSFTANESTDLGNNPGWMIVPRISQNFYWIGGTGNWNDPAHWAFSSGGTSSGCLPSAVDDVFFDVNSFNADGQTVTINVENAYCRSMDWTGATNTPSLAGPMNNALRLGGSLTFIPAMRNDFAGAWFFESNQGGNTLTAAGQPFNFDLTFAGATGEWTLQDSIYVDWNLYLNSGTLRTNDQPVDCNRFLSQMPTQRTLILGSSHFYTTARDLRSATWDVVADNLTLDAGTSTIESRGAYSNLFRHEGNGNIRYHKVIFNALEGRLFSLLEAPNPNVFFDSLFFLQRGFIAGSNTADYWYMSPGYRYDFVSDATQTIGILDANGNCAEGFIYIQTSSLGYSTNFQIANDQTFERLYLHGIQQQGVGTLIANNSLDGGGNTNWTFNTGGGRTLYWVADGGDWNDQASWSLSSGGPGGECIPTPIDDVIFDTNSFTTNGANVSDLQSRGAYCRDLRWEAGITQVPRFLPQNIYVHGSLFLASNVDLSISNIYLNGDDEHSVTTGGVILRSLLVNSGGTYTLEDALQAELISHIRGTLITNDQDVTLERFFASSIENPKRLVLGDTYMTLTGENSSAFTLTLSIFSRGMVIEPGTSTLEFTHPNAGMRVDYELDFYNVLFSEPSGRASFGVQGANYNRIDLYGDGTVDGFFTTDSLLCAPGKTYVLSANQTVAINAYWQIIGNNCTPVELRSDVLGTRALVSMPATATVVADFIQMRDIEAVGGADFRAGARSTDIANSNVGWLFEDAPEFSDTGLLGPDVALCSGEPVTLDAFSFSANETYRWQDGSTNATLEASQTGTYSVVVTFENNCIIRDTINVISAEDFSVDLPDDLERCDGEMLTLDADVGITGAAYTWQDGSTNATLAATTAGTYFVEVSVGGCLDSDTTRVSINQFPNIDLGGDQTACTGEDFSFLTNEPADTYLWQDGSTGNSFTATTSGIYWLEAANGSCASRDSVVLAFVDLGSVNLGVDTTICSNFEDFTLRGPALTGVSYQWQDGSTADTLRPTVAGTYWLEISAENCRARDSITVDFQTYNDSGIPDQIVSCAGALAMVTTTTTPDAYLWSDGETDTVFVTAAAGMYFLDATYGDCVFRKSFEVVSTPLPDLLPLGPDQTRCAGETVSLVADTDVGSIQWQDGSTNSNFVVRTSGTYWYTADNESCIAGDTITVTFNPIPELDLGPDVTLCEGETTSLETTILADDLVWQDGSGGDNLLVSAPGVYWLEATANACSSRDSVRVTYVAAGSLNLGADTTFCNATTFTLMADLPGATFTWQDGTTGPTYEATTTGSYSVLAEVSGCNTTDTIALTFVEVPGLGLEDRYTLCDGEDLSVSATPGGTLYNWSTGDTDAAITIDSTGEYVLIAVFEPNCTLRSAFTVEAGITTPLDLGPDTTICENQPLVLAPPVSSGTIRWPDGSTQSTYTVNGPELLTATLDVNGCLSSDTLRVDVKSCRAFQAYFPNAFSPNADNNNDVFRPAFDPAIEILDYELQVFDRWGAQLFRSEDPSTGWDGRRNGEETVAGVYIYFLRIRYRDDLGENSELLSGDVLLLR